MAATPSVDDNFTFVGGLNTEGGYFVVPKNSWKEGNNVIPDVDGSLSRRKGFQFEADFQTAARGATVENINKWAYTVETWTGVNGNGNVDFFVVQEGPHISFYTSATPIVSAAKKGFEINLADYRCFGNTEEDGVGVITTASCYGKLLITSINTDPILVIYEASTDTVSVKRLDLIIRDFQGIRSPQTVTAELTEAGWTALSFWPHALYNLYNQGWKNAEINLYRAANGNLYPSNTKSWIYGKDTNDDFTVTTLAKQDFGTSPAPKGRILLKAFYQDRATALGNIPDTDPLAPEIPEEPNFNDRYDAIP